MRTIYDVAVIGGGIAGAAAVISLSRKNKKTLWIHSKPERSGPKVGESLAPAANPILADLGISDLTLAKTHRSANTSFSAWGQSGLVERNSVIHLEGAGRILDRQKFESDLVERALAFAAKVVVQELKTLEQDNGVWLLGTQSERAESARFFIDASGRAQAAVRALAPDSRPQTSNADHLVAACAFLKQKPEAQVIATPATLVESAENGWWYASLLPDGMLSLSYYSDPDLMPKGLPRDLSKWRTLIDDTHYISRWIDDAEFSVDEAPSLSSAATRWLSQAAGVVGTAGWGAIGDAAIAFDPISAHGMTTALWGAARAAEFVDAHLAADTSALEHYTKTIARGREEYLAQRKNMYQQEQRFQHSKFWQRRQCDEASAHCVPQ